MQIGVTCKSHPVFAVPSQLMSTQSETITRSHTMDMAFNKPALQHESFVLKEDKTC